MCWWLRHCATIEKTGYHNNERLVNIDPIKWIWCGFHSFSPTLTKLCNNLTYSFSQPKKKTIYYKFFLLLSLHNKIKIKIIQMLHFIKSRCVIFSQIYTFIHYAFIWLSKPLKLELLRFSPLIVDHTNLFDDGCH